MLFEIFISPKLLLASTSLGVCILFPSVCMLSGADQQYRAKEVEEFAFTKIFKFLAFTEDEFGMKTLEVALD